MQQRGVEVRHMMQGRRAEDQIESVHVREGHQVGHDIPNVRSWMLPPSDVDQRLADVDANDIVIVVGEQLRVATCAGAGIQSPLSMRR
jgi:hypothetical protein